MDNKIDIDDLLSEWAMRSPDGLVGGHDTLENIAVLTEILDEKNIKYPSKMGVKSLNNKIVMNKKASKLLENIITECECDNRIETGIFDVYNTEHLVVLSEHMALHGISESVIEDAIQSMVDEGKYPERQAYNKEGWLVTFPSKEYRDAAIKKKTHFSSDPTHGTGGMNLYYKRKGKQKRQTAQAQSSTAAKPSSEQPSQTKQPTQPSEFPTQGAAPRTPEEQDEFDKLKKSTGVSSNADDVAASGRVTDKIPKSDDQSKSSEEIPTQSQEKPTAQPTIDVPVITQPPEEYASISKKFVAQKGWTPTEYGEYRDAEGNPIAVVGLSGEIVPIKSNDREEYKIFAEKLKT